MQPTDPQVRSVFAFFGARGPLKEAQRVRRYGHQGLVGPTMKARLLRIMVTLSSIAMIAAAGGASLRVF